MYAFQLGIWSTCDMLYSYKDLNNKSTQRLQTSANAKISTKSHPKFQSVLPD